MLLLYNFLLSQIVYSIVSVRVRLSVILSPPWSPSLFISWSSHTLRLFGELTTMWTVVSPIRVIIRNQYNTHTQAIGFIDALTVCWLLSNELNTICCVLRSPYSFPQHRMSRQPMEQKQHVTQRSEWQNDERWEPNNIQNQMKNKCISTSNNCLNNEMMKIAFGCCCSTRQIVKNVGALRQSKCDLDFSSVYLGLGR